MMSDVDRAEEQRQIDAVLDRLIQAFPYVPDDVISETVADAHRRFDRARIREFVPMFVERQCRAHFERHPAVEISA